MSSPSVGWHPVGRLRLGGSPLPFRGKRRGGASYLGHPGCHKVARVGEVHDLPGAMGVRTLPEPKLDPKATHSQSSMGASEGGGRSPTASFSYFFKNSFYYILFFWGRGGLGGQFFQIRLGSVVPVLYCLRFRFGAGTAQPARPAGPTGPSGLAGLPGPACWLQQCQFSMTRVFSCVFV